MTNACFNSYLNYGTQVTDSQSVDVETLRKTLDSSPAKSLRGSSSSVVNLSDEVLHPTVGAAAHGRQQKQFENGDVIVTLLPVNERLPWVSPARFRPELVPEELMAPALTASITSMFLVAQIYILCFFLSHLAHIRTYKSSYRLTTGPN